LNLFINSSVKMNYFTATNMSLIATMLINSCLLKALPLLRLATGR